MSRRTAARARIAAQREAMRRQERRRRVTMIATIALVAVVAVVIGWWSFSKGASEQATGNLAPITLQRDGSVVMARPGVDAPVVDVYEDFQCPACRQFEETSGSTVKNLAAEGKAKVVYHVITIFTEEPTRSNSLRAGSAARCVTDGAQWMAFHDRLYQRQPAETETGFTVGELLAWGREVGVTTSDFDTCVREQRNLAAHQQYSSQIVTSLSLTGTPTVKLNGRTLDTDTAYVPSALRDAVAKAAKG